MIEILKDLPNGIDGVKASGMITKEDYERVFVPLLDEARRTAVGFAFYISLGRNSRDSRRVLRGKTPISVFTSCDFLTAARLSLTSVGSAKLRVWPVFSCPVAYGGSAIRMARQPLPGWRGCPKALPFLTACSLNPE